VVVIGFDTDAKGSIAILDCRIEDAPTLDVYAVPNRHKVLKSGTKRLGTNYPALAALMVELISSVPVDYLYLEEQWSRPDQAGMFTFGQTFGDCRTAVAGALIAAGHTPEHADEKIVFVPGGEWKHEMRLDSDKSKSLALASAIFPECKQAWKLVSKHTSAAEASLLALYGASKKGIRLKPKTTVLPPSKPTLTLFPSLVLGEKK